MWKCSARDAERLAHVRERTNRLPLGAAPGRHQLPAGPRARGPHAGHGGWRRQSQVCQNSLDAVSDRDFAIEFTAAASLCMVHISRMSEEFIIWMSQNFGFIKIADRFTTGSSIMPQKKNPDVPELARGKTGRVVGHLMGLITLMKGQPLAYNKDNQEDKEPLFDTVDTLKDTLRIFAEMVAARVNPPPAPRKAASPSTHRPWKRRARAMPPPPTWPTTWSKRPAFPRRTRNRGPCREGRHHPCVRPV